MLPDIIWAVCHIWPLWLFTQVDIRYFCSALGNSVDVGRQRGVHVVGLAQDLRIQALPEGHSLSLAKAGFLERLDEGGGVVHGRVPGACDAKELLDARLGSGTAVVYFVEEAERTLPEPLHEVIRVRRG